MRFSTPSRKVAMSDLPADVQTHVRREVRRLPNRAMSELSSLGPCKVYGKRQGAVVYLWVAHYGYYDCCQDVS